MILSNCAGSNDLGTPTLQVSITDECDRLLVTVPDPLNMTKENDSSLALNAKYKQKLALANGRIVKGRECFKDVRTRFEAGK